MEGTKQELERTLENKKITKEEYDCRINDAEFEARAQIEQSICSMGSQGECLALRVKDPFLAEQLIPDAQDISDLLN